MFQERPKAGAKVVRIKRTRDGLVEQGCDVYIGSKIQNEHWALPWSDWANPFFYHENALEKYEAHIRYRPALWQKLDELEGKLLGCWCKDTSKCHGSVLVQLLEEKKMKELQKKFKNAGLVVDTFDLELIRRAYDWAQDPRLLAYATRLDRTNIFYFQAPVLEGVLRLWNMPRPHCWPARTSDDQVYLIIGMYDGPQPLGPFWDDQANLEALEDVAVSIGTTPFYPAMPHVLDLFLFAKMIQTQLKENPGRLYKALEEALHYHVLHRSLVKRVGAVTQVDMDDHDLSKSRIVQVALAYWHHWSGPNYKPAIKEAAMNAVKAGHCELENHHPEFERIQNGTVNAQKLMVDRLSVHIQKDPTDKEDGWAVDPKWIPTQYRQDWETFKKAHSHKDLYHECLYKAKKDIDTGSDLYKCFPRAELKRC